MEIGIFIYNGVESMDFCGPLEVFTTASRISKRPINVSLIAPSNSPIRARGDLSINPHFCIHGHPRFDLLIVAGGKLDRVIDNQAVLDWLAETATHTRHCASICSGVFLFAKAGLIEGKTVTTHWQCIEELSQKYPHLSVINDKRFVTDQNFTSSAGVASGIDMSLDMVKKRFGFDVARKTAHQMDYLWSEL
ncbi:DJ-1/PfpI family protein [Pseudoalteromonas luteoviolacea]|nr:DJ-1/PfpI family protein [Pseudoalteromonas luteoviolacea]MBQ4877932.1 DJ-1/PfpI family protein [Pseudoalteromonas luteoviolacea]MBQ4906967.1 DJ-1/PfpI family protein [Pseudoalteromonas luteoviolacea]